MQQGEPGEGDVAGHPHLPGQDHLVEVPGGDPLGGVGDRLHPRIDVLHPGHLVARRSRFADRGGHHLRLWQCSRRTDRREPAGPVGRPAHHDLGYDERRSRGRVEGEGGEGHRTGAGPAELVVAPDRSERLLDLGQVLGVEPGDLDPERLTPAGESVRTLLEHDAVGTGHVQEIDVGVDAPGAGDEGHGQRRVPV